MQPPPRRELGLLALACVALTAWRLGLVAHLDWTLFYDEAQYWDWSRAPAWGYYSKPPLIAWLIAGGRGLFGDSVVGVKALPMLLYPLSAVVVWRLARALHPAAGLPAALTFITLPMVGLLGLYATTDAPLLLTWALAAWALWQAQTTDRLSAWAALGLACGLGLLAKYTMAAFALTALPVLWCIAGPRRGLARPGPWIAVGLAGALLLPNLAWNAHHGFPTLHHTAEITAGAERGGGLGEALLFLVGQGLVVGPVAAGWALASLRRALRRGWDGGGASAEVSPAHPVRPDTAPATATATASPAPGRDAWRFALLLTVPLLLLATAQSWQARANLNWAAPAHIGTCLLLALAWITSTASGRAGAPAAGAASHAARALRLTVVSNLVLTALVAHLGDLAHAAGQRLPSKLDVFVRMRGWDHAFADLDRQLGAREREWADPSRPPLVLADDRLLLAQSAYEWRAHGIHPVAWKPQAAVHDHYELTTRLAPQPGQTVWLLTRGTAPADILSRFADARLAGQSRWEVAPGRWVQVQAYALHGFKGYEPR